MAIMPPLAADPTLSTLQGWVREMKVANGFNNTDFRYELALLMEEVGELAKAHRKQRAGAKLTAEQRTQSDDVGEEIADVLIYLINLGNIAGVDIPAALQAKLEKNRQREWTPNKVAAN